MVEESSGAVLVGRAAEVDQPPAGAQALARAAAAGTPNSGSSTRSTGPSTPPQPAGQLVHVARCRARPPRPPRGQRALLAACERAAPTTRAAPCSRASCSAAWPTTPPAPSTSTVSPRPAPRARSAPCTPRSRTARARPPRSGRAARAGRRGRPPAPRRPGHAAVAGRHPGRCREPHRAAVDGRRRPGRRARTASRHAEVRPAGRAQQVERRDRRGGDVHQDLARGRVGLGPVDDRRRLARVWSSTARISGRLEDEVVGRLRPRAPSLVPPSGVGPGLVVLVADDQLLLGAEDDVAVEVLRALLEQVGDQRPVARAR